jgi:hypothetical protein
MIGFEPFGVGSGRAAEVIGCFNGVDFFLFTSTTD